MIERMAATGIPGCYELFPRLAKDLRGVFIKVFNRSFFAEHGFETGFSEEYYSVSRQGVLRGLHFQVPPMEHAKLVHCMYGSVLDVVADLRIGSPAYGRFAMFELDSTKANMIYLPRGLAHGFYALKDASVMAYHVTSEYVPQHEQGIRWDSLGIPWPDSHPILSRRDAEFPPFCEFKSPFQYKGKG